MDGRMRKILNQGFISEYVDWNGHMAYTLSLTTVGGSALYAYMQDDISFVQINSLTMADGETSLHIHGWMLV